MPKKTKREKIIAEYRRTHGSLNEPASFAYQFTATSSPVPQKREPVDMTEFTEIRRDLMKTLVLAVFAIIIEFIFYRLS